MSEALAVVGTWGLSPAQVDVVRRQIAVGATDDELAFFLATCQSLRLDPFAGQIHFVKRRQRDPRDRERWIEVGTTQIGIKGLRRIAHRSGRLSGIRRGVECDESGTPVLGWAEVHRSDWDAPVREEVTLAEAIQTNNRGEPIGLWRTRPAMMLKKAAERAALELCFPVGEDLDAGAPDREHADVYDLPDGRAFDPVTGEIAEVSAPEPDDELEGELIEEPPARGAGPPPAASASSSALDAPTGGSSSPSAEDTSPEEPSADDPWPIPEGAGEGGGAEGGTAPPSPAPPDDAGPATETQWERAAEIFGSRHDALRAASAHLGRTCSERSLTRGELASVIAERLRTPA